MAPVLGARMPLLSPSDAEKWRRRSSSCFRCLINSQFAQRAARRSLSVLPVHVRALSLLCCSASFALWCAVFTLSALRRCDDAQCAILDVNALERRAWTLTLHANGREICPENTLHAEKSADGQGNAKCVLSFMAVIKSIVAFSDSKNWGCTCFFYIFEIARTKLRCSKNYSSLSRCFLFTEKYRQMFLSLVIF